MIKKKNDVQNCIARYVQHDQYDCLNLSSKSRKPVANL